MLKKLQIRNVKYGPEVLVPVREPKQIPKHVSAQVAGCRLSGIPIYFIYSYIKYSIKKSIMT